MKKFRILSNYFIVFNRFLINSYLPFYVSVIYLIREIYAGEVNAITILWVIFSLSFAVDSVMNLYLSLSNEGLDIMDDYIKTASPALSALRGYHGVNDRVEMIDTATKCADLGVNVLLPKYVRNFFKYNAISKLLNVAQSDALSYMILHNLSSKEYKDWFFPQAENDNNKNNNDERGK